jgi:hypothetical protein
MLINIAPRVYLVCLSMVFIGFLLLSSAVGQDGSNLQDVVYLKDGTSIKGIILEQVPNKSIKLKAVDGTTYVYDFNMIEKITKEPSSKPGVKEVESVPDDPETWMTDAQFKEYQSKRLSITTTEQASLHVSSSGGSGEQWTQWKAYEGFKELTEEDFFVKTGYPNEAEKVASAQSSREAWIYGGLAASALGWILAITADTDSESTGAGVQLVSGVVLGLGGLTAAGVAVVEGRKNTFPYSTVYPIAEHYNRKLALDIKDNY